MKIVSIHAITQNGWKWSLSHQTLSKITLKQGRQGGCRFHGRTTMWPAKRTRTALICFAAAFATFASASFLSIAQNKSQEVNRHLLFVVRERVHPLIGSLACPQGRVVYGLSYSVITVFTDGTGTNAVWQVPPCSDPAGAIGWTAPADGKTTHSFAISQSALIQLRSFLDRPEVKQLRDFMNAGPGVGDYDIEIHRGSEVQRIPVVSLMPEHDELKRDPTLLLVICNAKEIGGDERPHWCPNPHQGEPVGTR